MLMHFHCQLNLKILFKLLSALKLVKDKLRVRISVNEIKELFLNSLKPLLPLPHVSLALNYVDKEALLNILSHGFKNRLYILLLFLHLVKLVPKLILKLLLNNLLVLELCPEPLLEPLKYLPRERKELLSGYLLLLIKIPPQLELVIDQCDRVDNVLMDLCDLLDLFLSLVLEHRELVVLVMVEALRTQTKIVVETLVHVNELVLRAIVPNLIFFHLSCANVRANNRLGSD